MRVPMLVLAAAMVLSAGCDRGSGKNYEAKPVAQIPPAKVEAGNEHVLLPMKKGNEWTYTVRIERIGNGQALAPIQTELTWKVTDVKVQGGSTIATIEEWESGKVKGKQVWRADSKGLYQVGSGTPFRTYSTPQPIIVFPVKEGATFSWSGTGPAAISNVGSLKSTNKILGAQEVDTDAGRVSAIPVESQTTITATDRTGTSKSTVWLAPNVGIVRYRQETASGRSGIGMLLRLKSHSLVGN